ncbi:OLC1v1034026C4 [Oldenlandia corymbosa var. corymbosa]|uniref:OLC1v1034026C4 n=1 Tax=Oldenlandia corymbosa var. corymbosa TaxID=529605 RepID=A0AAV1CSE6_OLDCO|nr:OLC1v1034026C4 [Oldenlandia corymbosa var. corymbosa]
MDCCIMRPNRSDVHLSREEEAKMEEATRQHFDSLAPKRHTKPQRSEYSKTYTDAVSLSGGDVIPPEFVEFQRLENDHSEVLLPFDCIVVCADGSFLILRYFFFLVLMQKLVYKNGNHEAEEFVETEYYKDLNGVDKQHHTTGTGFISMDNMKGKSFSLDPDSDIDHHDSCKGNPATNDWIPAPVDEVEFVSGKPKRSEN